MKYSCLILDHDDTVVNSTATLHYPAFRAFMELTHPENLTISLEEYFAYNFSPGVLPFFRDICGLSEEEMQKEEAFWSNYVKDRIPPAYEGIREILWEYKEKGGKICVASHSFGRYILRDYQENGLPKPDLVFGWELEPALRKPSPYAIRQVMETYQFQPAQILVVDDSKPGYEMAMTANVPFAAAGWAHGALVIDRFMQEHSDIYLPKVENLRILLLG